MRKQSASPDRVIAQIAARQHDVISFQWLIAAAGVARCEPGVALGWIRARHQDQARVEGG
jgi:hypothetical protein